MATSEISAVVPSREGSASEEASAVENMLRDSHLFSTVVLAQSLPGELVFTRYRAMQQVPPGIFYTQDDDCWVFIQDFVAQAAKMIRPGVIVCNMDAIRREQYRGFSGVALVGFGGLLHQETAARAIALYDRHFARDMVFHRECDRIITGLSECVYVDCSVNHLKAANQPDRLWRQPDHWAFLEEAVHRVRFVKSKEKDLYASQ